MRIHILGICGTFMAGIALLARAAGHTISGSDKAIYPPMSTQLAEQGITLMEGYDPAHLTDDIEYIIVGNIISRGNPLMEEIMSRDIPYISGPEWLAKNILAKRHVLAVTGTHGKTTTTSMLTWILESAGLTPGFLIGGVPENFGVSARLGNTPYFVIEADEYDCAFFDKRPKFMHYHPRTLIINNLEFDHADIYPNLAAIQQQFHFLIRTVPGNGKILYHAIDKNIDKVLAEGCWTPTTSFDIEHGELSAQRIAQDGSHFHVFAQGKHIGEVKWQLLGNHNINNALAAIAAAQHIGVPLTIALEALPYFRNVKRRLEVCAKVNDITIYDDFAHHPTAITTTLAGLRARIGKKARIIAVLELGSYTMRTGHHKDTLAAALTEADLIFCHYPANADWDIRAALTHCRAPVTHSTDASQLPANVLASSRPNDHIIIMSNSGFGGVLQNLLTMLSSTTTC